MTALSLSNLEVSRKSAIAGLRLNCALTLAAVFGLGGGTALAMPAASTVVLEAGAPSFVVLGPEALGLSTSPIDLHLLPDGRVLVVSQHELAFGDGVRWETHRGMDDQPPIWAMVAVDNNGQIYTGIGGGIARIELGQGGRWRLASTAKLPPEADSQQATLNSVATFSNHWYWYGSNGAIVSWRPGQTATIAGKLIGAIEQVFTLGENVYVSDQSSGALVRLSTDGVARQVPAADAQISERVTCAVPFKPGQLLVGTGSAGLKLFDGETFRPFGPPGLLGKGHRITDLCATGEGLFAASIDTIGIVFFDRDGRMVQVLERSLDHRLARVRRLEYAREGVLWALLNDGVARVEFPSPISHFEPLLASGLSYAQPLRHRGQLWILADGQAMHGIYDASGRLEGFKDDTPPGRFLFTLTDVEGQLFASNDEGVYVYEPTGWRLVLPGIVNARIGVVRSTRDGICYVARGEYGMIIQTGQSYTATRILVPDLGDSYGSEVDSMGIGWIELGVNRVGRLDLEEGKPMLRILGPSDGISGGWVEIYVLDGIARFHLATNLFRFDDKQWKFVEDIELLGRIPQLAVSGGRPVTDSFGRLWYTANGATQVIDRTPAGGGRPVKITAVGFAPTSYTAEKDGVVWMFEKRRLARMDLRLAQRPDNPPRALITSVEFPSNDRHLFNPGVSLESLNYADNSLVIHFAAPANPFAAPLTFEVLLEGAGTPWVSTGAVGSATFNRLKEGDYLFRVRPVTGGATLGAEARLQFTVRPPWFRTPLAWVAYAVATVGLFAFVTWVFSYLQRRENVRLERVVATRTGELNTTNTQLSRQIVETTEKSAALSLSEERYRLLNTGLEDRVRERTAELSRSNAELQQRELLFRLIFEHAPVGISWKRADLGGIYHLNAAFRRILALLADTLLDSSPLATLVHADDAPHQTEMNRLIGISRIDNYNLEERFVLPDGPLVWGSVSVAVVRDLTGRIIQEIGILEDITARKRSEAEMVTLHQELLDTSRRAGMAEVAASVLHNVGNVLNSVNVSVTLVADIVRRSKSANLAKLSELFDQHAGDLAAFLTADPKGAMVRPYLRTLTENLVAEQKTITTELVDLRKNVEHIKEIVANHQSFAKTAGVTEKVVLMDLVEDAIRIEGGFLARHDVELVREYLSRPVATIDRYKVMEILRNLLQNAERACDASGRPDKRIAVRIADEAQEVRISVSDNGVGIPAENITRIFAHGFTTKKEDYGFGLHSGALAAQELGGSLTAQSDGLGYGATFTLALPGQPDVPL